MSDAKNIVFIMPDQLRHDFLGCGGADFVDTPNIDRLAAEGIRYERAYSASPICVPARASLLTGMDAIANGVTNNITWLRPDLADCGISTWPELLGDAGYYPAAVGKMHFYPWDSSMGFQYRVAAEDKRWIHIRDDYYHFLRKRGLRKLHGNEHEGYFENKGAIVSSIPWEASVDHFIGQEAVGFIERHGSDGPFALMVGFAGPHCPYDPVEEFLTEIDAVRMPAAIPATGDAEGLRQQCIRGNRAEWNGVDISEFTPEQIRKVRAHYAALVQQIDYEVGAIIAALEGQGLLDDTVIVFTSDHGDFLGDHGMIGKSHYYEASCHIPMIVRDPSGPSGVVRDELVLLRDITATMLSVAGVEVPGYMDSRPLPHTGAGNESSRDVILGMTAGGWMIFDGTFKLAKYSTGEVHLFNLKEDPQEQQNLVRGGGHRDILSHLDAHLTRSIMESVRRSHGDKLVEPGGAHWANLTFAREGWARRYPEPYGRDGS